MSKIIYFLLFAIIWLLSLIPFFIIYVIADFLYLIIYYLIRYRKKVVFVNLKNSFPEKNEKEIESIAKGFYHHFCDFWLEAIKGTSISRRSLKKRFKINNIEVIDELENKRKNIALVMAHYNNWEWLLYLPECIPVYNVLIIYRPLKNTVVDRITQYIRRHRGVITVPMDNIYKTALKYKNEKKLFTVLYLADQRPPRSNTFWTRFLNQEASFFQGTEKMARKLDMAVVYLDIQKVKRGYYELFFKKLFEDSVATKDNEITLACVKEMENEIKRKPDYWLWSHKRFKHKRPEEIKLISE